MIKTKTQKEKKGKKKKSTLAWGYLLGKKKEVQVHKFSKTLE